MAEPPLADDLRAAILARRDPRQDNREVDLTWTQKLRAAFDRKIGRRIIRRGQDIIIARELANVGPPPKPGKLVGRPLDGELARPLIAYADRIRETHDARRWIEFSIRAGYSAFVALLDDHVVGYLWYATADQCRRWPHPHLARLGLDLAPDQAYMFDLFIDPSSRGGGNAVHFVSCAQLAMRNSGVNTVFGYVAVANLSARVLYRTLGWQESRRVQTTRYLNCLLRSNGRWFIRNRPHGVIPVDYRPLFAGPSPGGDRPLSAPH